ncbi:MAG TPA: hypothetical protein VJJ82_02865 [Candidatus Nanoarchaeia archaeon]|nr:hypothetical protein [Candidatus Nanoarchaeia archaeon]
MNTSTKLPFQVVRKNMVFLEIDAQGKLCSYTIEDDPDANREECEKADRLTDWEDWKIDRVEEANRRCVGTPEGYAYEFRFPESRPTGDAMLLFYRFGGIAPAFARFLPPLQLEKDDIIAHLNLFYPNGRKGERKPEHVRQGVGTQTLAMLLEDARNRGAQAIYAGACSDDMSAFLEKRNWLPGIGTGLYAIRLENTS